MYLETTIRIDEAQSTTKLYEIDARRGAIHSERVITESEFYFLNDIGYVNNGSLTMIGPNGPAVLPSYDLEAWKRPLGIAFTSLGYIVHSYGEQGPLMVYLGNDGQRVWEKQFPRRTQSMGGTYESPGADGRLLVMEEARQVLVCGPAYEGLYVLSLDTGEELFEFNLPRANMVSVVAPAPQGGYYLGGWTWDSEDNIGVVVRITSTGEEVERFDQVRFVVEMGVTQQALDTCWFIAAEGSMGKYNLYKWQLGSDPVIVVENVGFMGSRLGSLIVLDRMVIVSGRQQNVTSSQSSFARNGSLCVVESGVIREYTQQPREPLEVSAPVLLGVYDNTLLMLLSERTPLRLVAVDLNE